MKEFLENLGEKVNHQSIHIYEMASEELAFSINGTASKFRNKQLMK